MTEYDVTIIDGSGSETMNTGSYTVSAIYAPGYDMSTLSPTNYTVSSAGETGEFTLSANGTLTITFNETGEEGGTPITSGSVVMTDSTGETQYGQPVEINSSGIAVFDNVPYGSAQSAYTLYFKQLTSDETHNTYPDVFAVGMGAQTQQEYILNTPTLPIEFPKNKYSSSSPTLIETIGYSNSKGITSCTLALSSKK